MKCPLCSEAVDILKYHIHLRDEHGFDEAKCPLCVSSNIVNIRTLGKHMKQHHDPANLMPPPTKATPPPDVDFDENEYNPGVNEFERFESINETKQVEKETDFEGTYKNQISTNLV